MRLTDRVRPFIPAIRLPVRLWSPRSQVSHANPPPRDPLVPARSPPAHGLLIAAVMVEEVPLTGLSLDVCLNAVAARLTATWVGQWPPR
jgi:hypothetical protein